MKKALILIFFVFIVFQSFGQLMNLQWHHYLKAGAKQNLSTYQDVSGTTQRGIITSEGLQALSAKQLCCKLTKTTIFCGKLINERSKKLES